MMKKWVNFEMANFIWNILLAILLVVSLFRMFSPVDVTETGQFNMTHCANGDMLVITPGGALVGISDDGGIIPYVLRANLLKDMKAVFSIHGAIMAIDREGRLFGWKSRDAYSVLARELAWKPTQLLTGVREVEIGGSFAAIVSETDELFVMDSNRNCVPCMEGYSVKSCRQAAGIFYVITSGGELYYFKSETDLSLGRVDGPIAVGVVDVNVAKGLIAQCLMDDGTVRLLSSELDLSEPMYDNGKTLCFEGLIDQKNHLLVWKSGVQNSDELILEHEDVRVAAAASKTLYLTSDGKMHWEGMAFPVSINALVPTSRNLLCIWIVVKILLRIGRKKSA